MGRQYAYLLSGLTLLFVAACSANKGTVRPDAPPDTAGPGPPIQEPQRLPPVEINSVPVPQKVEPIVDSFALRDPESTVFFALGSVVTLGDADAVINAAAKRIKQSHAGVLLIGHTDDLASNEYCVALSARRIAIVEAALRKRGLGRASIQRRPMGKGGLTGKRCHSRQCREASRSVEIVVLTNDANAKP